MSLDLIIDLFIPLSGLAGIVGIVALYMWVVRQDAGTERMRELARFIREGANAFLRREFITIVPFVAVLAVLLYIAMPEGKWQIAFGFVAGAVFSMLAIFIGMNAAVRANVRTANAARTSIGKALTVAFRGGSVIWLSIVTFNMPGILLMLAYSSIAQAGYMLIGVVAAFPRGTTAVLLC